ncbi:transporter substrate-binding domain-containing protein [Streptomyces sp. H27-C3]|uniref:transporter substrate-binding domain-containing protein n=1 Tax=Streptomyces sp. H27-C3 TaxID=3046305 RepID=UPI0024BBB364|nr:transporter substrate-binding domain-containing protein [Streptomyces sp. H27-C3]MDJ0466208.1 transporter substrate-binding domain-containing protein [Streptomyces sp. H27-C3]
MVRVGTNSDPPLACPEGGRTVGVEPDPVEALGERLGVTFQFEHAEFADLLTGLRANRFDAVMSGIHDTPGRRRGPGDDGTRVGPGVDFVRYLTAGTSTLVRTGGGRLVAGLSDLCGRKVAVQADTTVEAAARQQARACKESGAGELKVDPNDSHKGVLDALESGRADAALMDYPSAAHSAREAQGDAQGDGNFEVVGPQTDRKPYGIAFSKDADKLREAVAAALKSVFGSGDYAKILKKWHISKGALRLSGQ